MLEKELAQATKMAEQASKRVEQLRQRLLKETEKTHDRVKRELAAALEGSPHFEEQVRLTDASGMAEALGTVGHVHARLVPGTISDPDA